jgi:formamidase
VRHRLVLDRDASIVAGDPGPSHNRLHPGIAPVATIEPGDELQADCRDGMDGELRRAASAGALRDVDLGANHPLTGPVAVRGARPGDVLVVELLALDCDAVGSTAVIPGFGLLSDRFPEPLLVRWDITDGVARSEALPGVAIAGRPFLGAVAVAPSAALLARATAREAALGAAALPPDPQGAVPQGAIGREGLRTIPPRENGGNLDIRQLTVGSRLHLPVHVEGALLSLGDAHFAQGDGESCGTAIEVAATARVRVTLRGAGEPGFRSAMPAYEYVEEARPEPRRWIATTGIPVGGDGANADMDVRLAARNALSELVDWIAAERGLTPEAAYVLASVAADLRISEVVNVPNPLVSAALPLDVFEAT